MSHLTLIKPNYNFAFSSFEESLKAFQGKKKNIYMGIGLISKDKRLSEDLPIDVIKMLFCAKILCHQIREEKKEDSHVFVVLANSLAEKELGLKQEVESIVKLYHDKTGHLLKELKLDQSSSIILSSELEKDPLFTSIHEEISSSSCLEAVDVDAQHYVSKESAITRWMHLCNDVGCKIGWITSRRLHLKPFDTEPWDEKRFDRIYTTLFPKDSMQFFYSKCGLKLHKGSFVETCPYIGFKEDGRLFFKSHTNLKELRKISRKESKEWFGLAQLSSEMKIKEEVSSSFISDDCIRNSNQRKSVFNLISLWVN